jgi:hypothetical protein
MFSPTVRSWYRPNRWGMYPIIRFTSRRSLRVSCPPRRILPAPGRIMAAIMRSREDFPAPSDPMRPKMSPRLTARWMSLTAERVP